ncbi:hypothetical protein KBD20_03660 [Candidatus Saccharibacteria bacterium]|nr:hypothetical protein [Candidatus Saccharibacteria bacterium]
MGIKLMRGWDDGEYDDPMDRSMAFRGSRDWSDPDEAVVQYPVNDAPAPAAAVEAPDPNPDNFRVVRVRAVGSYISAIIHYPGCTTFEGNKLLVLAGVDESELDDYKRLDPHFSVDSPVVARFKPDEEGWEDALLFMRLRTDRLD